MLYLVGAFWIYLHVLLHQSANATNQLEALVVQAQAQDSASQPSCLVSQAHQFRLSTKYSYPCRPQTAQNASRENVCLPGKCHADNTSESLEIKFALVRYISIL